MLANASCVYQTQLYKFKTLAEEVLSHSKSTVHITPTGYCLLGWCPTCVLTSMFTINLKMHVYMGTHLGERSGDGCPNHTVHQGAFDRYHRGDYFHIHDILIYSNDTIHHGAAGSVHTQKANFRFLSLSRAESTPKN